MMEQSCSQHGGQKGKGVIEIHRKRKRERDRERKRVVWGGAIG
jgi:hypothetical protein